MLLHDAAVGIEELARVSAVVAATRGRLKKIELLSALLQRVPPAELPIAVKFLSGELTQGKIGLGSAAVRKSLDGLNKPTDGEQRERLSLADADALFTKIATIKGKGSTASRIELLLGLLSRASDAGRDFLVRLILGELRHGALEGIMVEAVATATKLPAADVRRAVMLSGDLAAVARVASSEGGDGVRRFSIELFRPLQPMLAEPAEDVAGAMQRLGMAALEYKLDGVRVQVHKWPKLHSMKSNVARITTRDLHCALPGSSDIAMISWPRKRTPLKWWPGFARDVRHECKTSATPCSGLMLVFCGLRV